MTDSDKKGLAVVIFLLAMAVFMALGSYSYNKIKHVGLKNELEQLWNGDGK